MSLVRARLAEQKDGDAVLDEVQAGEVLDELLVDRRLEGEVEVLKRLSLWETSESKARLKPAVSGVGDFFGDDPLEEFKM